MASYPGSVKSFTSRSAGELILSGWFNDLQDEVNAVESDLVNYLRTGWLPDSSTWTYASSTTFTISGDVRTKFPVGTKISCVQSSTTKYFYVVSSSYSAPNTTITVFGGSSYSLANATITAPKYSYAAKPQGFPSVFTFSPSVSGFTVVGTPTYTGKISMVGNLVTVTIGATSTTSIATTAGSSYITMPVSVGFSSVIAAAVFGQVVGNGIIEAATSRAYVPSVTATGNEIGFQCNYFVG